MSHSRGQGDLPDYTCAERLLECQKGMGRHHIVGEVNLPIGLFARIQLGWEMRAHTGGPWDIPNTNSEPGKARWLAKGKPEEMPHKSDSNYNEGATLPLSPPICLSTRTLFPPNKHYTCFTALCLSVEIHFYPADGPGSCHWPLVYWLGFSALTAVAWLQSLARNRNPTSSHCRPRPSEIS